MRFLGESHRRNIEGGNDMSVVSGVHEEGHGRLFEIAFNPPAIDPILPVSKGKTI